MAVLANERRDVMSICWYGVPDVRGQYSWRPFFKMYMNRVEGGQIHFFYSRGFFIADL
jgi:hypothetical protein